MDNVIYDPACSSIIVSEFPILPDGFLVTGGGGSKQNPGTERVLFNATRDANGDAMTLYCGIITHHSQSRINGLDPFRNCGRVSSSTVASHTSTRFPTQNSITNTQVTSRRPSNFQQVTTSHQPTTLRQVTTSRQLSTTQEPATTQELATTQQHSTMHATSNRPQETNHSNEPNRPNENGGGSGGGGGGLPIGLPIPIPVPGGAAPVIPVAIPKGDTAGQISTTRSSAQSTQRFSNAVESTAMKIGIAAQTIRVNTEVVASTGLDMVVAAQTTQENSDMVVSTAQNTAEVVQTMQMNSDVVANTASSTLPAVQTTPAHGTPDYFFSSILRYQFHSEQRSGPSHGCSTDLPSGTVLRLY